MGNYQLTEATNNDINQINNLLRQSKAHWGYDEIFLDKFIEKFGITSAYLQSHSIRLLLVDAVLAGFYNFSLHENGELELDNFFLHPDYMGKGWGKKLWELCCEDAKKLGKTEFIIWSEPNAEKFYQRMGCIKIGERKSPMMPDRHPPIMKYTFL